MSRLQIGNPAVDNKTNILDIKVPDQMKHPITTGMPHIDLLCTGTGMLASTVLLLTGLPSMGKTTCAMQLADSITRTGNISVFNTCEESLFQIKRRLDDGMIIKHGFIPSYESDVDDIITKADSIQQDNPDKKLFLIIDSLQTIEVTKALGQRGRGPSQQTQAVEAAWRLAAWAKRTYNIVIMIGQVTKDGVFAGKQEIKHAIDCHLHLSQEKDRTSEHYGERIAEMEKNRFGIANVFYPFSIKKEGIVFYSSSNKP